MIPAGTYFRPGTDQDRPFFADCIRRTLKDQPYSKDLSNAAISRLIDPILGTYRSVVLSPDADSGAILGFVLYDNRSVAWIHVRAEFRRTGITRAILRHIGLGPGQVSCPLLVVKWPGGSNFPKACQERGYTLRFRPWTVLEIEAQLELGDS
jgi:hypothetical protein